MILHPSQYSVTGSYANLSLLNTCSVTHTVNYSLEKNLHNFLMVQGACAGVFPFNF